MSYQVLARKWRPQRFDDVLGQPAVTRTLTNALKSGGIAQAFVFAGPRGCGKTTTARLLARALNCVNGPTADPCGVCDACVEIAEGRDIDVLEIDAATHTGVDNVREVIIEGLSIAPVRSRYKVFLIDEVHMLSASSFNALAQVDRGAAAARHLHDGDDRAAKDSRNGAVAGPGLRVPHHLGEDGGRAAALHRQRGVDSRSRMTAVALLARAGEGSMRDSLSALDQVRAFAGDAIDGRRRRDGAGAGRPRPGPRHPRGRCAAKMPRRRSRSSNAPSSAATTCVSCAASWRARPAICWCSPSIRRAPPMRISPRKGSAPGSRAWSRNGRARICCADSIC